MLSLVNYGGSDSEDEITDEEEEQVKTNNQQNGEEVDILTKPSVIKLPAAQKHQVIDEEDDDEFLHKKEVPEARPPPPPSAPKIKQKVKIMIPKLSDFKEDVDDELEVKKYPTAPNRKTGLLGMLPKPTHSLGVPVKAPQISQSLPSKTSPAVAAVSVSNTFAQQPSSSSSQSDQQPKKIGFIPYALMDHKKAADSKKLAKKKDNDSSSDEDDEEGTSFFTFSSKDEDLPKVSEEEIKSLIAKEANRIEQRKRHNEGVQEAQDAFHDQQYTQHYQQQQQETNIDQDAMKMLVGGNKAKRSKMDEIQILDLTDREVLPNREEWLRKTLAGETSYVPTGQIDDKGPNALAKRKHQLTYLSVRAEKNTAELEAMWAANRQNNREARSKYGF